MTSDRMEIDAQGMAQLLSAAESAARPEVERMVAAVIGGLREMPPVEMFGEIASRHMWDEYCWLLQTGPYDEDFTGFGGSLDQGCNDLLRSIIEAEIETLPRHAKVFLSIYAAERIEHDDEYEPGSIWIDGIASLLVEEVSEKASHLNLDLIGPHRGDVISSELSSEGVVCSALSDAGLFSEILASHVDVMIDPEADLSSIAHELVDAYVGLIVDETESSMDLSELFERFGSDIKTLLIEKDVLPDLVNMHGELQGLLDA
ncbi:hypothetical protein [Alcanivorax hongdengensis]|nr:hypothetical protein [Alcanivorax hongdengensis]